jgi:uncharacterized protein (TIGR02118 family)
MVKSIVVARRKEGMSRKEFYKYWEQTHGPLAAKMIPGLRRYVQNHFVDVPGIEYDGDGVVEMWYDDIDAYLKSMEYLHSEEGRLLMEDGDNFADMTDAKVWIVEEHVIL